MAKVAVITGAGKGIGRATALRFAREGIDLALFTRTAGDYETLGPELDHAGVGHVDFVGDLSNAGDIDRFAASTRAAYDRVDYIINNAGVFQKVELKDSRIEDFDRLMSINVRGSYLITRAFIGDLIAGCKGVVVFVSSVAGLQGFPGGSLYSCSKFAIQGLADSLMLEVRKRGVRVTTVCPGRVNTPMMAADPNPPLPESVIQPEDVAETIYLACTLPDNAIIKQVEIRSTAMRFPG
jgi:3-oxoacyl-[acyl-carrier protein] reductase